MAFFGEKSKVFNFIEHMIDVYDGKKIQQNELIVSYIDGMEDLYSNDVRARCLCFNDIKELSKNIDLNDETKERIKNFKIGTINVMDNNFYKRIGKFEF